MAKKQEKKIPAGTNIPGDNINPIDDNLQQIPKDTVDTILEKTAVQTAYLKELKILINGDNNQNILGLKGSIELLQQSFSDQLTQIETESLAELKSILVGDGTSTKPGIYGKIVNQEKTLKEISGILCGDGSSANPDMITRISRLGTGISNGFKGQETSFKEYKAALEKQEKLLTDGLSSANPGVLKILDAEKEILENVQGIVNNTGLAIEDISQKVQKVQLLQAGLKSVVDKISAALTDAGNIGKSINESKAKLEDLQNQIFEDGGMNSKIIRQEENIRELTTGINNNTEAFLQIKGHTEKLNSISDELKNLNKSRDKLSIYTENDNVFHIQDKLKKLNYHIPEKEIEDKTIGVGTRKAFEDFKKNNGLKGFNVTDESVISHLDNVLKKEESGIRTIQGRLYFQSGRAANDVTLRLYKNKIGGETKVISTENVRSDQNGYFTINYKINLNNLNEESNKEIDFVIKAVQEEGKPELAISSAKYKSGNNEILNLIVPDSYCPPNPESIPDSFSPVKTEFERLSKDIEQHVAGFDNIKNIRENGVVKDITQLHYATGWDARLIALLYKACCFNEAWNFTIGGNTQKGVECCYGLFRTGISFRNTNFSLLKPEEIRKQLNKAVNGKIISISKDGTDEFLGQFEEKADSNKLDLKLTGGLSSPNVIFDKYIERFFTDAPENQKAEKKKTLTRAYLRQYSEGNVWDFLKNEGFDDDHIKRLKVNNRLTFLTHHNVHLNNIIFDEIYNPGSDEESIISGLVDKKYYNAAYVETLLKELLDSDSQLSVSDVVPPIYKGSDNDAKIKSYARDISSKIQKKFPTRILRKKLEENEMPYKGNISKQHFTGFLKNAEEKGFQIENMPVNKFIREKGDELFEGLDENEKRLYGEELKKFQRLRQITPSDESMKVLLENNFTSAYEITQYTYNEFIKKYESEFPTLKEAELTYRKAEQVVLVAQHLLLSANNIVSPTDVATIYKGDADSTDINNLTKEYPTLENIFGDNDYYADDPWRSILSPAAYLVELLRFIDEKGNVDNSPFRVLNQRRPDIANLQLTPENTETMLPCIDLANEILEHYVANGEMQEDFCFNSSETSSEELIAEPENINLDAYKELNSRFFPAFFPFDLNIETVREMCNLQKMPLSEILEKTFTNKIQFDPVYIQMEYLNIVPSEYTLLTNFDYENNWFQLLGYADAQTAKEGLTSQHNLKAGLYRISAKKLARRLNISYVELKEILQTYFINPNLVNLNYIKKLGLEPSMIFSYLELFGTTSSNEEKAAVQDKLAGISNMINKRITDNFININNWLLQKKDTGFSKIVVFRDSNLGPTFEYTDIVYKEDDDSTPDLFHIDLVVRICLFVRFLKKTGSIKITDGELSALFFTKPHDIALNEWPEKLKNGLNDLYYFRKISDSHSLDERESIQLLSCWFPDRTFFKNQMLCSWFRDTNQDANLPFMHMSVGAVFDINITPGDIKEQIKGGARLNEEDYNLLESYVETNLEAKHASIIFKVSLYMRFCIVKEILGCTIKGLLGFIELLKIDILSDFTLTQISYLYEFSQSLKKLGLEIEQFNLIFGGSQPIENNSETDTQEFIELLETISKVDMLVEGNEMADGIYSGVDTLIDKIFPADKTAKIKQILSGTVNYASTFNIQDDDNPIPSDFWKQFDYASGSYDEIKARQNITINGFLTQSKKDVLLGNCNEYPYLVNLLEDIYNQCDSDYLYYFSKAITDKDSFEQLITTGNCIDLQKQLFSKWQPLFRVQQIIEVLSDKYQVNIDILEELLNNKVELYLGENNSLPAYDVLSISPETYVKCELYKENGDVIVTQRKGLRWLPGDENSKKIIFSGYISVPSTEAYRFLLTVTGKANIEFRLSGVENVLICSDVEGVNKTISNFCELNKNVIYKFKLVITSDNLTNFSFDLNSKSTGKIPLSSILIYSEEYIDQMWHICSLIQRIEYLMRYLNLDNEEANLLFEDNSFRFNLNLIPLTKYSIKNKSKVYKRSITNLIDYLIVRNDTCKNSRLTELLNLAVYCDKVTDLSDENIFVIKESARSKIYSFLAGLLNVNITNIQSIAEYLDVHNLIEETQGPALLNLKFLGFYDITKLRKYWECVKIINNMGISPKAINLIHGLYLSEDVLPFEKKYAGVRLFKQSIKAQYPLDEWISVSQDIFDEMRKKKRDHLVAWLLKEEQFSSVEKLFEYFLIDPATEPVVKTSRLKQATLSVQLFIERCLMNLEPDVMPSEIKANQWQWLKNYRVFEANKKIFLYPENWLEPEFRDDKTYIYKELEENLLQGDINKENIETCFFKYLRELEKISKLEIVSTFYDEEKQDSNANRFHVLARIGQEPKKYYYRTLSNKEWSPWIPVDGSITGENVAIAVWQERVNIFWLSEFEETEAKDKEKDKTFFVMANESTMHSLNPLHIYKFEIKRIELYRDSWLPVESSGYLEESTLKAEKQLTPESTTIYCSKECGAEYEYLLVHLNVKNTIIGATTNLRKTENAKTLNSRDSVAQESTPNSLSIHPDIVELTGNESDVQSSSMMEEKMQKYVVGNNIISFRFKNRNTKPEILMNEYLGFPTHFKDYTARGSFLKSCSNLNFQFESEIKTEEGKKPEISSGPVNILKNERFHSVILSNNLVDFQDRDIDKYNVPFFYQDTDNVFFIQTNIIENTQTEYEDVEMFEQQIPEGAETNENQNPWDHDDHTYDGIQSHSSYPAGQSQFETKDVSKDAVYSPEETSDWIASNNNAGVVLDDKEQSEAYSSVIIGKNGSCKASIFTKG